MPRLYDDYKVFVSEAVSAYAFAGMSLERRQPEDTHFQRHTLPMHVNEEFAAATPFGGRIAHGMLTASVISAAIANRMPGPGTIYLGQNLRFRAPVRPGETVHATVTVTEIVADRRRVTLSTICRVGGKVVVEGDALVMTTTSQPGDMTAR